MALGDTLARDGLLMDDGQDLCKRNLFCHELTGDGFDYSSSISLGSKLIQPLVSSESCI
jgi:hypothetical protein